MVTLGYCCDTTETKSAVPSYYPMWLRSDFRVDYLALNVLLVEGRLPLPATVFVLSREMYEIKF